MMGLYLTAIAVIFSLGLGGILIDSGCDSACSTDSTER